MTTVPLSEAKTHLARLLADVEKLGEGVTITRSGRPAGVLLSIEEYEGLIETLDILADAKLMASLRKGLRDAEAGRTASDAEVWR
ncbi:MAG TPA: type II toxin-antitoxin system Phd/YefM family antitoxin [Thermoanaerobaculaceae bacterium]|nr:type II toxin-antitoxin system Phd/YefM family antitoxin [Thermoanaerobaculaceae bacterium]